jgi:phosphomannomutase
VTTLRECLAYEPRELKFGTSGRRGELEHLTQLEIYVNVRGELAYLQGLSAVEGGIRRGDAFYFGYDLRPSSTAFSPAAQGRGELCQAVERAARDAGMEPVCVGPVPTPAVMAYAVGRGCGSIMVTGSHIPFDRNGYKLNTSRGELLKQHEAPINQAVAAFRKELYSQAADLSPFDARGMFKWGHAEPAAAIAGARDGYFRRYTGFFGEQALAGLRVLLYEHSAVGRDLLAELLRALGAEVVAAGRSDTFVPIDTENMDAGQLGRIQSLVDQAAGPFDAIVSTDGDSDRPLLLGIDEGGGVRFFGGDLVGMVVASWLGADSVVVPVTCNDGIDRGSLAPVLEPKTRIGSPYVIAGMEAARGRGRIAVCGWEANGGFLTASDIERNGKVLPALLTRDAFLPIAGVLTAARERGSGLPGLFGALPRRFSGAGLLKDFRRATAAAIVGRYTAREDTAAERDRIRRRLGAVLTPARGFGEIVRVDDTDGVRVMFDNGDVAHFRPSGNADEFRVYACADSEERANAIVAAGIAADGFLREMEAIGG